MKSTHPSQALQFCPFCGSKNFIWDNVKSHTCLQCGNKLYVNAAGATIALIYNAEQELLFTTRKHQPAKGTLDLPGGFIDIGETAEQCVKREVKEELNLEVRECSYYTSLPNTYEYKGLTYFTIDMVFVCKVDDFSSLKAGDDAADCRFLPVAKVPLSDLGLNSVRTLVHRLQISSPDQLDNKL
ncbi:MAG: NUDIX domain-containing protein [Bacteroidales bacterium]|nr:NUDIX domain-containing protein [Bacteroidales bacterium]